jgi:hypothetical protein
MGNFAGRNRDVRTALDLRGLYRMALLRSGRREHLHLSAE